MVKWTKDEEEQILQGWPVKEHRDAIAEELGRSKAACATRYRKLIKETPAKDLTGDAYVEKVQQMKEEVVEEIKETITPTKAAQEISEKITEIIEQNEAELAATNGKLKEVKEELKEEQVNNVAETVEILSTKKDYKYTVRIVALLTILGCSYLGWYLYA
jgi:DNA repair exonuclease SbcCD ATPase subunit